MTLKTQQYVHKPSYVDAIQVTTENMADVAVWCLGEVINPPDGPAFVSVPVHRAINDRQKQGFAGDWVLSSRTGFRVFTAGAFKKNFEKTDAAEKVHKTVNDLAEKFAKPGDRRKKSRSPEVREHSAAETQADNVRAQADELDAANERPEGTPVFADENGPEGYAPGDLVDVIHDKKEN